jgi:hypothetical protein
MLSASLGGCLISTDFTADDVRNGSGLKENFVVSLPFEAVVNRELAIADSCFDKEGARVGFVAARSEVNLARKSATILFGYDGPRGFAIWSVIDLAAKGDDTEIRTATWSTLLRWHDFGTWVKEWANGGTTCHVGAGEIKQ